MKNDTKISQVVLEILDFKFHNFNFLRKKDKNLKCWVFLDFLYKMKNNGLCDVIDEKFSFVLYTLCNISFDTSSTIR